MGLQILLYFSIGLVAGFTSGMFGIGAGSIRIPLLNFVGLSLLGAYGINLFVIPFSSTVAAYSHRSNIDYRVGLYMLAGGACGSVAGAFLTSLMSTMVLAILFVIITLSSVFGMYLDRIAPKVKEHIESTPRNIIFGTMALNMVTGLRGGSGGSVFPSFLRTLGFDIRKAIATSLFATIFTASAAVVVYWKRGDIIWLPAIFVLAGSIVGARIGSQVSLKTKPVWLEVGLSVLVSAFAFLVIYKSIK